MWQLDPWAAALIFCDRVDTSRHGQVACAFWEGNRDAEALYTFVFPEASERRGEVSIRVSEHRPLARLIKAFAVAPGLADTRAGGPWRERRCAIPVAGQSDGDPASAQAIATARAGSTESVDNVWQVVRDILGAFGVEGLPSTGATPVEWYDSISAPRISPTFRNVRPPDDESEASSTKRQRVRIRAVRDAATSVGSETENPARNTVTVYVVDSADRRAVHFYPDCPALERSTQAVNELDVADAGDPIATAALLDLEACAVCLQQLSREPLDVFKVEGGGFWAGGEFFLSVYEDRVELVKEVSGVLGAASRIFGDEWRDIVIPRDRITGVHPEGGGFLSVVSPPTLRIDSKVEDDTIYCRFADTDARDAAVELVNEIVAKRRRR